MKTICIDIDGTICRYEGWTGPDQFGDVLPGAREAIAKLKQDGWFIIIYTTRADKTALSKFLRSKDICFDAINENPHQPQNAIGGKPMADVYLDDRAVTFKGNWAESYNDVIKFKPWE